MRRTRVACAALSVSLVAAGVAATTALTPAGASTPKAADEVFRPQLVKVSTPTRADKARLQGLGLDLTEHAGHDYVEVVVHTAADQLRLRNGGFATTVTVPDLLRREAENNAVNDAFAAATVRSALPSGRDAYRNLADYETDMSSLATGRPTIAKRFALPHKSLDGRTIYGIEIGKDVQKAEDGRPVFALFGAHHAREWPSAELAMEFATDLVKNYGSNSRITKLLERTRVIVVPVVNVDGFHLSRTDGDKIDLRDLNESDPTGGNVSVLGTPGQTYKRKNCRIIDGVDTPDGSCAATLASPGGFGAGVDLNRNYGGFWGGPGASGPEPDAQEVEAGIVDPTYRGAAPFSEPETQNVRELVSKRQVTTLISNHTFSNLVLRPNGVHPDTIGHDGHPVGDAPDEAGLKKLGAAMTAANGYQNIHGWELYDTTGTTEDWSYNATGGYGYTFEIGPNEFHPPFPQVVDEYVGAGKYVGKGNREAYLLALENAANPTNHALVTGTAPAGATLRLRKEFASPTWSSSFKDTLNTTMQVPSNGKFTWHINQSTRPVVQAKVLKATQEKPLRSQTFTGGSTTPTQTVDHPFTVTKADAAADVLNVELDWPTPDDFDLTVFRKNADGSLTEVGASGNAPGEKEAVRLAGPTAGTYVLRVTNYASVAPSYTLTASLHDVQTVTTGEVAGLIESWTLTLEVAGKVRRTVPVTVDRGGQVKVNLR